MKSAGNRLTRVVKTLVNLQYGVSIAMAFILLGMIGFEVVSRYVLKTSLMGVEELMVVPIIWLYMLGGADASYEKSHIECGILSLYIKKDRSKLMFEVLKRTICFIVLVWMEYWGIKYYQYSLKVWKIGDITGFPLFYANIAITVGFFLMAIYAIRDVINAWKNLFLYTINSRKEKKEA